MIVTKQRCEVCELTHLAEEFYESKTCASGLFKICIACLATNRYSLRETLNDIRRQGKCMNCSYSRDWRALEFAHFSRDTKARGRRGQTRNVADFHTLGSLLEEVAKTRLLCVCCHRMETRTEIDAAKLARGPVKQEAFRLKNYAIVNAEKLRRGACVDCGLLITASTVAAFDMDHKDRVLKLFSIGAKTASLEKVTVELAKCELRCGNCHRIKTWEHGEWGCVRWWKTSDDATTGRIPEADEAAGEVS